MNIGTPEIIVIAILALMLYGKRLPEIMRAVGKGFREFKNSMSGVEESLKREVKDIDEKIKEADKLYDQSAPAGDANAPKKNNKDITPDNLAG